jgi:uncharacterized protein YkwD
LCSKIDCILNGILLIMISTLFCINCWLALCSGFHPFTASSQLDTMENEILQFVNEDRKQHNLKLLQMNTLESSLALKHSGDMATGKVKFGHDGFNSRAKTIQKELGAIEVGENVASGPMTAREVVDGWLHSPGHKKNIEGDFSLTGIGYARDKKGDIYFTQIFSR